METTRLKKEISSRIKRDAVLCGKISQALGKSMTTVLYRMVPENDERLTLPRIQALIREHLQLSAGQELIEEAKNVK
jgi:hypothetical protein